MAHKRQIVQDITDEIVVGKDEVDIRLQYSPDPSTFGRKGTHQVGYVPFLPTPLLRLVFRLPSVGNAEPTTIGGQPTSRGLGWAIFESPLSVFDWGTISAKPCRIGRIINRLERLLKRYEPSILAIRSVGFAEGKRSPAVRGLQQRIVAHCETRGIHVYQYDREAIQQCFRHLGAPTRYEIAQFIAEHVDALRNRLPRKAPIWNGENPSMSIFDAAALAFTYFAAHGELY